MVWSQLAPERRAEVLLELSGAVVQALIEATPRGALLDALATLDADDLAYPGERLPPDVLREALESLSHQDRSWIRSTIAYPDDSVGHRMAGEAVAVRSDPTLGEVRERLLERGEPPDHGDQPFVVDRRGLLAGGLPLAAVLVHAADRRVSEVMRTDLPRFRAREPAAEAARAFERYDLVSAAVVDPRGKRLGPLTVDSVLDFLRQESETDAPNRTWRGWWAARTCTPACGPPPATAGCG